MPVNSRRSSTWILVAADCVGLVGPDVEKPIPRQSGAARRSWWSFGGGGGVVTGELVSGSRVTSVLVVRAQVDGAALRLARLERGMTQSELADVLRVAGGEGVSAWERGVNQPDVRPVPVLAEVLGVDPAALIGQRPPSLLRHLRWTAGLTALELGAALHVSRNSYLRYESGERSIPRPAQAVPRLAAALGVSEQVTTAALSGNTSDNLALQHRRPLAGSS